MTENGDREDDSALSAEYALGLLTPVEARAFEARMAVDPELRVQYALWAEDFASLADAIAPVEPPKSVLERLTTTLFPEEKQSWLQKLGLIPAILGGLAAALIVLVVTNQGLLIGPGATGPVYTAEIAAEDQSLLVLATYDPAEAVLRIDRTAGAAREGRTLQLWLIAGDNTPVSLGVLAEGEVSTVPIPETLLAALEGGVLAISDEPQGGSPTGQPTGDVLAVGPVVTL